MTKETYDILIACGFEFLNYPHKPNETISKFIRIKHPDYNTYAIIRTTDSLETIIREILCKIVLVGEENGKQLGKTEIISQFKGLVQI